MKRETKVPIIGIVDDDESVRMATSSLIRSVGYRAALFASAEAFLTSGQIDEMDCLIVDLHMPQLGGLELSQRLAEMNNPIPIIFVSALHDELRARALNEGAVAVLAKPFNDKALLSAIHSALQS